MAAKQELVGGLEFLIQEGRRIGAAFDDAKWSTVVDGLDGWKNKEVLAHVAGIGTVGIPFLQNMVDAGPASDGRANLDLDALNASLVAARAEKSVGELVDEIATTYGSVIEFVKSKPEDFWSQKRTFGGFKDVPISELGMGSVVLHGLGHIYSAYAATV